MSKLFTKTAVLAALEEIVAEVGPDYVYPAKDTGPSCTYADSEGEPSCIVGRVIAKIDPDLFKEVAEYEELTKSSWTAGYFAPEGGYGEFAHGVPKIDAEDADLFQILRAAQTAQDSGKPYSEALHKAKTATLEG